MSQGPQPFGTLPDGRPVERHVLQAGDLEVAVLSRSNGRRCFNRLSDDEVSSLLEA